MENKVLEVENRLIVVKFWGQWWEGGRCGYKQETEGILVAYSCPTSQLWWRIYEIMRIKKLYRIKCTHTHTYTLMSISTIGEI